jgi:hypothetical protein
MIKFRSALDSLAVAELPKKEAVLKKEAQNPVDIAEILSKSQGTAQKIGSCDECTAEIIGNTVSLFHAYSSNR